ncbi:unhealthy ribosome biogenesis protein 2 homolog [Trichomycterus rosablanca]|uniref:unhealthy ribosome biogenesis protein 2 homolog n=1 Tax=Trichomycterus rosablanca TaxID=2290929 RepID=UPI002F35AF7C
MATVYSGIHQKLKSHLTPWPEKLKLARFAWVSNQCLLPNKEQYLFDWIARALSGYYNKKVELPQEILEDLWTYLKEILHSQHLCYVLSQGKTIALQPAVSQIINERILERPSSVILSSVLDCCHKILSFPVLSVTYTAKYELLVELLARFSDLACFQLGQQDSAEPLSDKVFEVLLLVLTTYLTVQRQQGNPKRVFTQVIEHLIQPLCLLRHLLTSRTWMEKDDVKIRQNLSKEIRSKVDLILQSALFYPDHLPSYKDEVLLSEKGSSGKKGATGKALLRPIAAILSKIVQEHGGDKDTLFYAVQSSSLPLLFKFAYDSFCKGGENKLVCFHLMTKFVISLGFTDDLNINETFNPATWSLTLFALENLLNSCLTGDIYNIAADKIHHAEVQLNFYRKVAQFLFNNAQTGIPAWYRCLKTLLALNHQILEPDLDELLSLVWVDADNTELRVKKAREAFLCAVLQTYSKLRQLPRLIEELLDVICRPAADEMRQGLLSETLHNILGQCLLDNPPSQNLEICRLILERMQNDLPYIQERRNESALKMFSLAVLLHAVLFSLKTLDESTPVPIVRKTQSLMEHILTFVQSLLEGLEGALVADPLWAEKMQEVCFLLIHTWHETDTLFHVHCSKYNSPSVSTNDISSIDNKVVALSDCGGQTISHLSRLLLKLLALHRMKNCLLTSPSVLTDAAKQNLQETAQSVLNGQELLINTNPDQTWDRQLCSVNSDTYPVAFWFIVTTNLPIIAPFISPEVTSHIADTMLNSLLQSDPESIVGKSELSVHLISKQLLESPVFCELPDLHSAVVSSVTNKFIGILSPNDVQSFCPSFLKPCTEIVTTTDEEDSPPFKRLKVVAQEIMDCAKETPSILVSEAQIETLLKLVKLTCVLNPYAMPPDDYLGLFLSSFLMTLCAQHDKTGAPLVPVNLLKDLFGLMKMLLMGRNSHTILKIVHGSTLLKATITSLFSCFDKGLFQNVESSAWFAFLQSVQEFIQHLIHLILDRKSSVRLNLEKFTSFMFEKAEPPLDKASYSFQLHLATLSTFCKEMISVLGKNQQMDETLTQLLGKIILVMGPAVQSAFTDKTGTVLSQSFCIDVLTVIIKSELAVANYETQDITDGDRQQKLSNMTLYKSFGEQILKDLYSLPQPKEFLISALHYLSAFYLAAETTKAADLDSLHFTILQSVHKLLSGMWISISQEKELEGPMKDLFSQLMVNCSIEQFRMLFLSLIQNGLVAAKVEAGHYKDILATVTAVKLLACCSLSEKASELFWQVVPQIISSIVSVVKEFSGGASLTSELTVPAVETLTSLLRQGESYITESHHVLMVLEALEFVPLENQYIEEYCSAFQAIHEALFVIILCYPKVMLKALPVFLNCFYRLVKSIIYEGRHKGENEKGKDSEKLVKCAMLIERMYTHIGTTAESFTVLNSFVVAQYVNELQRVTLQPQIKAHLTEGIYCILDHCVEQDIKFLNRTLSVGVQEVFNELYKNYTSYHKSQRQGEEKYTV